MGGFMLESALICLSLSTTPVSDWTNLYRELPLGKGSASGSLILTPNLKFSFYKAFLLL